MEFKHLDQLTPVESIDGEDAVVGIFNSDINIAKVEDIAAAVGDILIEDNKVATPSSVAQAIVDAEDAKLTGTLSTPQSVLNLDPGIYVVDETLTSAYINGFGIGTVEIPQGGTVQKLNYGSLIVLADRQFYVPYDNVNEIFKTPVYITEKIIKLTPTSGSVAIQSFVREGYYVIDGSVTSLTFGVVTPSAVKCKVLFTAGANCSVSGIAGSGWTYADGWVAQPVQGNTYLLELDEGRVHWHEFATSGNGSKFAQFQPKNLCFSNVTVVANAWTDNATTPDTGFEDYDYKAIISCSGVTAAMFPTVEYAMAQAEDSDYSRFCVSGAGTVTIYSNKNTAITIPLIKCEVIS